MAKHFKRDRFPKMMIASLMTMVFNTGLSAQSATTSTIDPVRERATIDSLNKEGARLFAAGDSVGMYKMYASDADLGGITGQAILSYWGKQMREAAKADMQNMSFATKSLSTDGEFLLDVGVYTIRGKAGDLKRQGKYLIVWKRENGTWKLYRDVPL